MDFIPQQYGETAIFVLVGQHVIEIYYADLMQLRQILIRTVSIGMVGDTDGLVFINTRSLCYLRVGNRTFATATYQIGMNNFCPYDQPTYTACGVG
jgi:hypothetical protein